MAREVPSSISAHGVAAGVINGDVHIHEAPAAATGPPRQLPAPATQFTGREEELARLNQLLEGETPGVVVVSAIAGKPGVGKSALAVQLAHQVRDRFPDGQLYVDLRGAEEDARRLTPGGVLGQFLLDLGVPAQEIPEGVAARAARYRSLVADRRVLVLLDNAHDEAQVRPLLPGTPGCLALITSRRPLAALEAAPAPLHLDVLGEREAINLLARLAGAERVAAEQEEAAALTRLCGGLPLALRIVGARLATRPRWRLADLRRRLVEERRRLAELSLGDLDVRASFMLSYRELTESQARLFRRLGAVPGTSFGTELAAVVGPRVLIGSIRATYEEHGGELDSLSTPAHGEEDALRDALDDDLTALADAQLIEPTGTAERHRFHDLLRLFARGRLDEEEPEGPEGGVAAACTAMAEGGLVVATAILRALEEDVRMPTVWEDEWSTLIGIAALAEEAGLRIGHLTVDIADAFVWFAGRNADREGYHRMLLTILASAERQGDWFAEVRVLFTLGIALQAADNFAGSVAYLERLVIHCVREGNHAMQARARMALAWAYVRLDRPADMTVQLKRVGRLLPECPDGRERVRLEAEWLEVRAMSDEDVGRWGEAGGLLERAAELFASVGSRRAQAKCLVALGRQHMRRDQAARAITCLTQGLAIASELGMASRFWADALSELAAAYYAHGDLARSSDRWAEAVGHFRRLGMAGGVAIASFSHARTLAALGRWDDADRAWADGEAALGTLETSHPAWVRETRARVGHLPRRPR
jgi:tetratricopeptide (TPR) repeat protein